MAEKLIESDLDEPVVAPDNPPDITADLPIRESGTQVPSWLRPLALSLLAVILVFGLVLLARWIYHASHNTAQTSSGTSKTATQSTQLQKQPSKSSQPSGSANSSQPSNPSASSNSSSATAANNSSTPKTNLPNNGPGDVVAIFAGASLAAAGLHYIYSLRRFSKPGS